MSAPDHVKPCSFLDGPGAQDHTRTEASGNMQRLIGETGSYSRFCLSWPVASSW